MNDFKSRCLSACPLPSQGDTPFVSQPTGDFKKKKPTWLGGHLWIDEDRRLENPMFLAGDDRGNPSMSSPHRRKDLQLLACQPEASLGKQRGCKSTIKSAEFWLNISMTFKLKVSKGKFKSFHRPRNHPRSFPPANQPKQTKQSTAQGTQHHQNTCPKNMIS